jgi:isopenicillin-N N-acyltransferase-like protein
MGGFMTLTLDGDHYAMGQQHGQQVRVLRPQIAEAMAARFEQIERDGPDQRFEALLRETAQVLEEIDGPLLAFVRGQAEALAFEVETLLRYDLVTYLRDDLVIRLHPDSDECTTWAAAGSATADGRPMLVKNRDYRLEHLPLQMIVRAAPKGRYRTLYVTSAGSPGVFCAGLNEAGLAVADTHVYSTDLGPGLPDYALMMHLLEEHSTVSSALDYLRSVPRLGRNNLILADGEGWLAIFECGHGGCGALESWGGTLVNTNHFVTPEMSGCFVDVGPPEARGRSRGRYETVTRELAARSSRIDVPFAQGLMAYHNGPLGSICCHPQAASKSTTISASIMLPAARRMLFCHGLPCQGVYDDLAVVIEGEGRKGAAVSFAPPG